jgi:hypothetical protein
MEAAILIFIRHRLGELGLTRKDCFQARFIDCFVLILGTVRIRLKSAFYHRFRRVRLSSLGGFA